MPEWHKSGHGLHRNDLAQGFQPWATRVTGRSADDVFDQASDLRGAARPTAGPPLRWPCFGSLRGVRWGAVRSYRARRTVGGPAYRSAMGAGEAYEAVAALRHALEDLSRATTWQLPEAELVAVTAEVTRLRSGFEAAYLRLVAEVEGRRAAAGAGLGGGTAVGASTEGFLRTAALLSAAEARRDVAAATALSAKGPLRGLAGPLARGEITRPHVDVAVRCLDRLPLALRRTDEQCQEIGAFFVRLAPLGTAASLKGAARQLRARLDPDGVDRFDPEATERRFLEMTTDTMGMLVGRFQLDAVAGATFRTAIDAAAAPVPAGADGTARDDRSAGQRRADALTVLAEAALAAEGPRRGERPRVVVHVAPEHLVAEEAAVPSQRRGSSFFEAEVPTQDGPWLEPGQPFDRRTARRLACDAVVHLLSQEPGAGRVLHVGREHRFATPAQRVALAARDHGCIIPGCGAQPAWCDAHHIQHWADGGATDLDNMALLCPGHHTAVHAGHWQVRMGVDGVPEAIPPPWVDPRRRPRRGMHHDVEETLGRVRAA